MSKSFSLFLNFDGNCHEALEFYSRIFQSEVQGLMTYDEMPPDPNFPIAEADKKRVMYSSMLIFGCNIMFCDIPASSTLTKGGNINLTLGTEDKEDLQRIFAELSAEGKVLMPLEKSFWSELYGMVQDKYGIIWQLSHDNGEMG